MPRLVTTVLVEQNSLFREGLAKILQGSRFRVGAAVTQLSDTRQKLVSDTKEALFIIGLGEDHGSCSSDVQRVREEYPLARIVVLADRYVLHQLLEVLRGGASGYLVKSISSEALIKSLDLVMLGETVLPSAVLSLIYGHDEEAMSEEEQEIEVPVVELEPDHVPRALSNRETEILRCLMFGASNKIIARKFDIAEATVKVHIKAILRKIRVRNRTQAAIWAVENLAQPAEERPKSVANG